MRSRVVTFMSMPGTLSSTAFARLIAPYAEFHTVFM
jgi:hypothetical protein